MEDMNKPAVTQPVTPGKKTKSNYLIPVVVALGAVAAFLLVWYFAVK